MEIQFSDGSVIQSGPGWRRIGTAGNGRYHIWHGYEKNGKPLYRATRTVDECGRSVVLYPEGGAGYRSLAAMLKLKGVTMDGRER